MMSHKQSTASFVKHIACPHCGSSDANSLYSDGHSFCFACQTYTPSEEALEELSVMRDNVAPTKVVHLQGTCQAIKDRGITIGTTERYNVTTLGNYHYYPYFDPKGGFIAAKRRNTVDKTFSWEGDAKAVNGLFGQHLFHEGGKYVTITEGELDTLAAYQMTGSQWPVVSVKNGAQGAVKDCKAAYEWLNSFENVVICFDGDEPGLKAANEVAELFGGKAKIVQHKAGYKDACDYLKAGATKEFVNEWWRAKQYVPDGIINAADLWDEVIKPEKPAEAQYPFLGLNKLLYGLREAELITVTAGSGLGKSQFLREILYHLLKTTDWKIGGMFLEESTRKTARSIMSLHANKLLHLPDTPVTDEELKEAFDGTLGTGRIFLYDHFGSTDADNIINRIRYLVKAFDCKCIFLDHISIVVSGQDVGDERKAIDTMMTKLRTAVQELNVTLICVSHLRRPQGNSGHEDGQAVSLSQLRGSGAIAQLSDAVITLERNSMAEDEAVRHQTKVAVAKNRYNGYTGPACVLQYSKETGRMTEVQEETL